VTPAAGRYRWRCSPSREAAALRDETFGRETAVGVQYGSARGRQRHRRLQGAVFVSSTAAIDRQARPASWERQGPDA
jgi:hypothetical protein